MKKYKSIISFICIIGLLLSFCTPLNRQNVLASEIVNKGEEIAKISLGKVSNTSKGIEFEVILDKPIKSKLEVQYYVFTGSSYDENGKKAIEVNPEDNSQTAKSGIRYGIEATVNKKIDDGFLITQTIQPASAGTSKEDMLKWHLIVKDKAVKSYETKSRKIIVEILETNEGARIDEDNAIRMGTPNDKIESISLYKTLAWEYPKGEDSICSDSGDVENYIKYPKSIKDYFDSSYSYWSKINVRAFDLSLYGRFYTDDAKMRLQLKKRRYGSNTFDKVSQIYKNADGSKPDGWITDLTKAVEFSESDAFQVTGYATYAAGADYGKVTYYQVDAKVNRWNIPNLRILQVYAPSRKFYPGQKAYISLRFNQIVDLRNTDKIKLPFVGNGTKYMANYVTGDGTDTIVFELEMPKQTITNFELDSFNPIWGEKEIKGLQSYYTLNQDNNENVLLNKNYSFSCDNDPPKIDKLAVVNQEDKDYYTIGDTFDIAVTFNVPVYISKGSTIELDNGGIAFYNPVGKIDGDSLASFSKRKVFTYIVEPTNKETDMLTWTGFNGNIENKHGIKGIDIDKDGRKPGVDGTYHLDLTPPTIEVEEQIDTNKANLTVHVFDNNRVAEQSLEYQVFEGGKLKGEKKIYQDNSIVEIEGESETVVEFYAKDIAGNAAEVKTVALIFDAKEPEVQIALPKAIGEHIIARVRDNLEGDLDVNVIWKNEGSVYESMSYKWHQDKDYPLILPKGLSDENYGFTIEVVDQRGNKGVYNSPDFIKDTKAPIGKIYKVDLPNTGISKILSIGVEENGGSISKAQLTLDDKILLNEEHISVPYFFRNEEIDNRYYEDQYELSLILEDTPLFGQSPNQTVVKASGNGMKSTAVKPNIEVDLELLKIKSNMGYYAEEGIKGYMLTVTPPNDGRTYRSAYYRVTEDKSYWEPFETEKYIQNLLTNNLSDGPAKAIFSGELYPENFGGGFDSHKRYLSVFVYDSNGNGYCYFEDIENLTSYSPSYRRSFYQGSVVNNREVDMGERMNRLYYKDIDVSTLTLEEVTTTTGDDPTVTSGSGAFFTDTVMVATGAGIMPDEMMDLTTGEYENVLDLNKLSDWDSSIYSLELPEENGLHQILILDEDTIYTVQFYLDTIKPSAEIVYDQLLSSYSDSDKKQGKPPIISYIDHINDHNSYFPVTIKNDKVFYVFNERGTQSFEVEDRAGNITTLWASWDGTENTDLNFNFSPKSNDVPKREQQVQLEFENEENISQVYYYEINQDGEDISAPRLVPSDKIINIFNEGNVYLVIKILLNTGEVVTKTSGLFTIDRTPPSVSSVKFSETNPTASPVEVILEFDDNTIEMVNNDGEKKHVFNSNGSYVFQFKDLAGNYGQKKVTVSNIDKTRPSATIRYSRDWYNNEPLNINVELRDALKTEIAYVKLNEKTLTKINGTSNQYRIQEVGMLTVGMRVKSTGVIYDKVVETKYLDQNGPKIVAEKTTLGKDMHCITYNITAIDDYGEAFILSAPVSQNSDGEYEFTENGEYVFDLSDEFGNISQGKVNVSDIDREFNPQIEYSTRTKTNMNVVAEITADENFEILEAVKVVDGVWRSDDPIIFSNKSYTFTRNGSIGFKLKDDAGNIREIVATVDWINKFPPIYNYTVSPDTWTREDVQIQITGEVREEGVARKINNFEVDFPSKLEEISHEEHIFKAKENGIYDFSLKDEYGNISILRVFVTKIDREAPKVDYDLLYNYRGKIRRVGMGEEKDFTSQKITVDFTDKNYERVDYDKDAFTYNQDTQYFVGEKNGEFTFDFYDGVGNHSQQNVLIKGIDNNPPNVEVKYTKVPNSQAIIATLVTPGFDTIKDEDVDIDSQKHAISHVFENNGIYDLKVEDFAGNTVIKRAVVNDIDKTPPAVKVRYEEEDKTNKPYNIVLTFDESVYINENEELYEEPQYLYKVEKNGQFYIRIKDIHGNVNEVNLTVDNLDFDGPKLMLKSTELLRLKVLQKDYDYLKDVSSLAFDLDRIEVDDGQVMYSIPGLYKVNYTAFDDVGNKTTYERTIELFDDNEKLLVNINGQNLKYFNRFKKGLLKIGVEEVEGNVDIYLLEGYSNQATVKRKGELIKDGYFNPLVTGWYSLYLVDDELNSKFYRIYVEN